MKKLSALILVLIVILSVVPAMAEGAKVAVICDPVGVNLFLTQVVEKVEALSAEYGYEYTVLECTDSDAWQNNYQQASHKGYDLILGVGWQSAEFAAECADEYEDIKYAVIDTDAGSDKVMSLSYNEEQAAYLMGLMAGYAFPDEEIYGYIGCFEGPGSFKYRWGFAEGVKAVNPDAKFMFNWTNSYSDPAPAHEFALQQAEAGCTYIFGGAAACNEGIFQAALERVADGKSPIYSIAQDADATTPDNPYILSAQLKNTGVSAQTIIDAFFAGNMPMGNTEQKLIDGAIGATHVTNEGVYRNEEVLTDEVIDNCKAAVEKIISGELVLTMPAEEDYVF